MTDIERVKAALEYIYDYVADNDPAATWAEAERKLQEALVALPRIEAGEEGWAKAVKTLERLKGRLEYRLNERLCEMKPDHDDAITGFNVACVIVAKLLEEELTRLDAEEPSQQVEEMKCSACGGTRWLRKSMWHDTPICEPCFMVWYDPDKSIDQTDPQAVGALSMELKAAGKAPWVGKYAEP